MASPSDQLSTRSMRLKVLYTFDAESKNNCLARWPHPLDIQSAFVDDLTQIGVIDLKTCLKALVSSSPEILSQDMTDYTIYAYDYSEEGTPLSGQGMLSNVFNVNTTDAWVDSSAKVVTGRVTKNVLGLFSGNGQETLEVKLRLLPVAKKGQSRHTYGQPAVLDMGVGDDQSFDAQGWSNPSPQDSASNARQQTMESGSPVDATGLENMQRMLHEGSTPRELSANPSYESRRTTSNSRPGSRSGTPSHAQPFNPPGRQSFTHISRPSSRASARAGPQPVSHKRRESFNSGYYSGDETQIEDGPARKRARVTQVGAPTRSDLNIERQPESLRMVASTASSVRVHRPVAINAALSNLSARNLTEEPVRPPTPIPFTNKPVARRLHTEPSSLRQGSQQSLPPHMPHPARAAANTADVSITSPEDTRVFSVSSTPANIPSSPPVMANYGSVPSSPMLPSAFHEQQDSGFMSSFDDMAGEGVGEGGGGMGGEGGAEVGGFHFDNYLLGNGPDAVQLRPIIEQGADAVIQDQFTSVFEEGNDVEEAPAPVTLPPPPKGSNPAAIAVRPVSRAQSSKPALRPGMSSPKLAPAPYPRARQLEEEMAAQSSLPSVAASDPVGRHLQRSNTWAGEVSDVPMSDAPVGEVGRTKSVSKKKVGREQTKARLENALAQNEMPPYCDNCGTIDTPAWRRVFAKTLPGHLWDSIEIWPEVAGAFVWKQVVEQAEDGTIRTFRGYKLSKSLEDKGEEWANVTLCNPCGLWFHKNKCMRPPEKWMRNPKDPNQKKKRAYRPKSKRVAAKKGQDDDSKSDAPDAGSEGSSPADGATEAEMEAEDNNPKSNAVVVERALPPPLVRAVSAEPTMAARKAGSQHHLVESGARVVQSSPVHNEESQKQPAETSLTPKPLRRQLFPSPSEETGINPQNPVSKNNLRRPLSEVSNSCRRSPRLKKSLDVLETQPRTPEVNKENQVSELIHNDDLHDLFNDDEDGFQFSPKTPTPTRRSDRLLCKTLSKTPSGRTLGTSSNQKSATQQRLSPAAKTLKADFIMGSNRTVEEMTPFTRLMHQELISEWTEKKKSAGEAKVTVSSNAAAQPFDLDFPDLPSLSGMSPMARQFASLDKIDFSGLNSSFPDIFNTDPEAMGSPADGYYNFLNTDFLDPGLSGGAWGETGGVNTQSASNQSMLPLQQTTPLRRSPRKNRST